MQVLSRINNQQTSRSSIECIRIFYRARRFLKSKFKFYFIADWMHDLAIGIIYEPLESSWMQAQITRSTEVELSSFKGSVKEDPVSCCQRFDPKWPFDGTYVRRNIYVRTWSASQSDLRFFSRFHLYVVSDILFG